MELQRCLTRPGGIELRTVKVGRRDGGSMVLSVLRVSLLVISGRLEPAMVISQV